MRRFVVVAAAVLCMSVSGFAQALRIGVDTGFISLGDVDDENALGGVHLIGVISDIFSFELSGSVFQDEGDVAGGVPVDIETVTIAATARASYPLSDAMAAYGGAGVSVNNFNDDGDVSFDSTIGYHLTAGIDYTLGEDWSLFGELRYAFLSLEGDIETGVAKQDFDDGYDVGIFRVGISYIL